MYVRIQTHLLSYRKLKKLWSRLLLLLFTYSLKEMYEIKIQCEGYVCLSVYPLLVLFSQQINSLVRGIYWKFAFLTCSIKFYV
jgi:hypothetical protein